MSERVIRDQVKPKQRQALEAWKDDVLESPRALEKGITSDSQLVGTKAYLILM